MHISNKGIISIVLCVIIVFVSYNYYAHEHWMSRKHLESTPIATSTTVTSQHPSEATFHVGETKTVGDITITLHAITGDSRCPTQVQCIQKGYITTNVTLTHGTSSKTLEIKEGAAPVLFEKTAISITNVLPVKTTAELKNEDYRISFTATKE